jgi:hypothetical protein
VTRRGRGVKEGGETKMVLLHKRRQMRKTSQIDNHPGLFGRL